MNKVNTPPQISTVGIIGMGYVGIPLALRFAEVGYAVIGFDVDVQKVANLSELIVDTRGVYTTSNAKVIKA